MEKYLHQWVFVFHLVCLFFFSVGEGGGGNSAIFNKTDFEISCWYASTLQNLNL